MKNIIGDIRSNYVVRYNKGRIYFFNSEGVYVSISEEEAKKYHFENLEFGSDGKTIFYYDWKFYQKMNLNMNLVEKVICKKLQEGETIEDFERYLSEIKIEKGQKAEEAQRFITKIYQPTFGRIPENKNKKTFDFAYVQANVISEWGIDRRQFIKENFIEIKEMMLQKLQESRYFKKYGIPVNFLKISKVTFSSRENLLEFIFELKDI